MRIATHHIVRINAVVITFPKTGGNAETQK